MEVRVAGHPVAQQDRVRRDHAPLARPAAAPCAKEPPVERRGFTPAASSSRAEGPSAREHDESGAEAGGAEFGEAAVQEAPDGKENQGREERGQEEEAGGV